MTTAFEGHRGKRKKGQGGGRGNGVDRVVHHEPKRRHLSAHRNSQPCRPGQLCERSVYRHADPTGKIGSDEDRTRAETRLVGGRQHPGTQGCQRGSANNARGHEPTSLASKPTCLGFVQRRRARNAERNAWGFGSHVARHCGDFRPPAAGAVPAVCAARMPPVVAPRVRRQQPRPGRTRSLRAGRPGAGRRR